MSWTDDVKEIERQRRMAEEMGGADSVAFQHGRGKLTVRERIDLLADPDSFHEIGALAGTATWEDGSVAALNLTQTPYICFVVRQLYGVAGGLHWRGQGLYRRYAWPSAHGGSMHIRGGTAIAYKREIEAADDPEAKRAEIEARLHAISSPFRNAHAFGVEEIIDPRDTRPLLVDFMRDARRVVAAELLGPAKGPSYRP